MQQYTVATQWPSSKCHSIFNNRDVRTVRLRVTPVPHCVKRAARY